jgi:hypothetical protein
MPDYAQEPHVAYSLVTGAAATGAIKAGKVSAERDAKTQ